MSVGEPDYEYIILVPRQCQLGNLTRSKRNVAQYESDGASAKPEKA